MRHSHTHTRYEKFTKLAMELFSKIKFTSAKRRNIVVGYVRVCRPIVSLVGGGAVASADICIYKPNSVAPDGPSLIIKQ